MKLKLDIHTDCHPSLIKALRSFEEGASKCTTASRGRSIWIHCKKEVEPTLLDILKEDSFFGIVRDGFTGKMMDDARKLEGQLRGLASIYSNPNWKDKKILQRFGTIETLIYLIRFCRSFRPNTYYARQGNEGKQELIPRLAYRRNLRHYPFCELCEKLCETEERKVSIENLKNKKLPSPSSRFCKKHRPGGNDEEGEENVYRRDHNHREAFHKKIRELEYCLGHRTYTEGIDELRKILEDEFYFEKSFEDKIFAGEVNADQMVEKDDELRSHLKNYPDSYSELDAQIRLVAYKIVHPKKEKTCRKNDFHAEKGYTLRKLRESLAKGQNISQAAKEAGVSRQAAWKALKKAADI
jgi:hypothetical protein